MAAATTRQTAVRVPEPKEQEAPMHSFPYPRRAGAIGAALLLGASFAAPLHATTVDVSFEDAVFSDPLDIDNAYFPLTVGDSFTYKGETKDGCEIDVVQVTGEAKSILGIPVVVVRDTAYEAEDCDADMADWELVEDTKDWYAQDNADNVWYFGEETYDCAFATCELGEGSWTAGVDGAEPGIIMLADPQAGLRYRQEYYEDFAQDWGMVMRTNATVRLKRDDAISPGEWTNCVITKDWNELEPGSVEQKYYCEGVGLVAVDEHSGAKLRFELVEEPAAAAAFQFKVPPGR